jgi:CRP-like cAMP-binding protein
LSPIEKVLVLQRVPLFSRVSADEMRLLAELARTVPLEPGTSLFPESAPPALWVVISGEVSIKGAGAGPSGTFTAGAGDVLGAISTMAGRPLGMSGQAVRRGVALHLDREDLFALLGERPELLRQIFSGIFRADARVG